MTLDEVIYRLKRALNTGRLNDWERGFTLSCLKHSKRSNWNPSDKQERVMRRIVREVMTEDMGDLIEA